MDTSEKAQNISLIDTSGEVVSWRDLYRDYLKRIIDVIISIISLPFMLPLLFILVILIKLDSKGPAIYKSERIGRSGKRFKCLKLRTMCHGAHNKLNEILEENPSLSEEYNKFCKLKNDPRVTQLGKFLRALSLDEIPQIFNVLRGEMSIVGPRPAFEVEIPKYGNKYKYYQSIKPGITGLWQINGRSDTPFDIRVEMDYYYVQNLGLLNDLKIILKTVPAALSKKGAY